MSKTFIKLLVLLITLCLAFGLVACGKDGGNTDGGNTDGSGNTDGGDDTGNNGGGNTDIGNDDPENLVLITGNVATFRLVTTSDINGDIKKSTAAFIENLTALGVSVDDIVKDSEADEVTDCEIIVGTGVRNRDAKYVLDPHDYGEDGYVIKIVDNKVLIGGGNDKKTGEAFDYFVKSVVKLTNKTKEMSELSLARSYQKLKETKYLIDSVTIGGNDLSEYVFVSNLSSSQLNSYDSLRDFRTTVYNSTGYWLESAKVDAVPEGKKMFSVSLVEDAGADGFRAYVDSDGNFIVECAYENAFDKAFAHIVKSEITDKIGNVVISKSYDKTLPVSVVYYSQFGAKGDGITDDHQAMYNAHVFANEGGQKVMGDRGATYFVHEFTKTIPVETDVDFNGATIHIDDRGSVVYKNRSLGLFTFQPSYDVKVLKESEIQTLSGGAPIMEGDTEVPWLVPVLEAKSFVYLYNKHQDYIRHGANAGYIKNRRDVFVIDVDGKVDPETRIYWDFMESQQLINNGTSLEYRATKNVTYMEIYRIDEKPITMENGVFLRDACESVIDTAFENKYHGYNRGLKINRCNVTVKDLKHELISEPYLPTSGYGWYNDDPDTRSLRQSYPYGGFLAFSRCHNSRAIDVDLWAHTTYYEVKTTNPTPVAMGSYDLTISDASNISLYGLTNGQDYNDSQYWGIMSSYGAKNMHFEDCKMNRFDAHDGFFNANLIDCDFGFAINVVGGGYLYIENTTKNVGNSFISLRGDYGATFRGDITIVDSELYGNMPYRGGATHADFGKAYPAGTTLYVISPGYSTTYTGKYEEGNAGAAPYLKWDFGYVNYMPQNIIMDNFVCTNETVKLCLYKNIGDAAFVKPNNFIQEQDWKGKTIKLLDGTTRPMTEADVYYNQYQITKSVIYRNMEELEPTNDPNSHLYGHLKTVTTVEKE